MKNSIAKKVTKRIFYILLLALTILLIGSFIIVQRDVYEKSRTYARVVVSFFSDFLTYNMGNKGIPLDIEHTDDIIYYGEYVCDWYNVDYVYLYVPDVEKGTLNFIAAVRNEESVKTPLENNLIGYKLERTLSPDELAVWNGESTFAHNMRKNQFGHELGTLIRVEDSFGNRVMVGVDVSYESIIRQILFVFSIIVAMIIIVLLGIYFTVYVTIRQKVSKPAQLLSRRMNEFITDGKRSEEKLTINDTYEYAMIADAFNSMTENIDTYLNDIQELTRSREHQATELSIAARIQQGFLPKQYSDTPDYRICAVMTPAKDVGGDLYDYVILDDDRVLTVIADVSGKGISAAMFMAITLIIIRQYAGMELSPAEILKKTNDTLSSNNAAMLFATAFVGIYNNKTKQYTYSNAGHNLPYIIGKEKVQILDTSCGTLLGLFPDEKYENTTVSLQTGDTIFLYTDGVNESTNPDNEFFGIERLEKTLENCRNNHAENPVYYVNKALSDFSQGTEPHDDTSMLALTVKDTKEVLLNVDVGELTRIKEEIFALPIPDNTKKELCLSAEECFVNICSYAFPNGVPEGEKVILTISVSDRIIMRFADGGVPFNPLECMANPEEYDIDEQLGGLGNLLAVSSADDVKYEYSEGKNNLTFIKYYKEEK